MLHLGKRTSSNFNTQHVATRCKRVAKGVQHVALNSTMFRYVALKCCDRLVGALVQKAKKVKERPRDKHS